MINSGQGHQYRPLYITSSITLSPRLPDKALGNKILGKKHNLLQCSAATLEPFSQHTHIHTPSWVRHTMENKWVAISNVLITCKESLCSSIKQFSPHLSGVIWWQSEQNLQALLFWSVNNLSGVDREKHWMNLSLVFCTDARRHATLLRKVSEREPQMQPVEMITSRQIHCEACSKGYD